LYSDVYDLGFCRPNEIHRNQLFQNNPGKPKDIWTKFNKMLAQVNDAPVETVDASVEGRKNGG